MEGVRITKLPRKLNENSIVYHEAFNAGIECPYCYTCADVSWEKETWYGTENGELSIFNLFKEKHFWAQFIFRCARCGAEWVSHPFRTDYPDDTVMREING